MSVTIYHARKIVSFAASFRPTRLRGIIGAWISLPA